MCGSVILEVPFPMLYCPDEYKTQRICDEAIDNCLAVIKFIPD